ncbi:MAG: hypothetical protein V3S34_05960, partial [Hyphomicrobium sp.]
QRSIKAWFGIAGHHVWVMLQIIDGSNVAVQRRSGSLSLGRSGPLQAGIRDSVRSHHYIVA